MNNERAIRILNALLERESRSVLPRIREANPFVTWASAAERRMIDDMIREETEHRAWLVDAIRDLGGEPLPVSADIASTNIHFLDLSYVLPTVLEDRTRVLTAYETAASQAGTSPLAADVIARITDRHRRQIDRLNSAVARFQTAPR